MKIQRQSRWGARQRVGLVLGPAWIVLVLIMPAPEGLGEAGWWTAGIGLLMATWWISEAIPIAVTSLLPLVLFPVAGVGTMDEVAAPYANPIIFLFMGGFVIALAMVRWGLHERVALNIVARAGTGPRALVGGFMVATALLSMWVTNTATTLMMLPVGLSVIAVADRNSTGADFPRRFALALLLGIAYAANIGGMGTLIGTAPNAFIAAFFESEYGFEITFARWLAVGFPLVVVGVPLTFWVLTRVLYPFKTDELIGSQKIVAGALDRLGPVKRGEKVVAIVFTVTAVLWITRPLLADFIPGLTDAGIAVAGGLALFLVPVDLKRGVFAQDWNTARELPWGVLILFGGGLSLASAVTRSGLAEWIGTSLGFLEHYPVVLIIMIATCMIIFLTELTSNAATTATFLPVMAAVALATGENPLLLALPAALAASCAFMLPVATPPNAIVSGSGHIPVPDMARAGLVLNLAFLVVITACAYTLLLWAFEVAPGVVPEWAQ